MRRGLLALLMLLPRPGEAQTPVDSQAHPVWRAVARIEPGTTVRLRDRTQGRLEGPLVSATPSAIRLAGAVGAAPIPLDRVDSLWVRGRATKTGAIIGAVPGAVGGAFLGMVANELGCQESGDACPEAVPLLGLAGAAAGALAGALVGSLIRKWHRRVP